VEKETGCRGNAGDARVAGNPRVAQGTPSHTSLA
jgi:hypothetical protein